MRKFTYIRFGLLIALIAVFSFAVLGVVAYADNSWGTFHWARTANPFTLKLGDNVSSAWDAHLATASSDWSKSVVLDTTRADGQTNPRSCKPVTGRVEVCSEKYGFNGWLGVARIWTSDSHIQKGTVKVNDTYFNTTTYNTPAWRRLVMCQEIGHTLGLDHQDETFTDPNLGTCMDYTSDPDGPPSNEHPNKHDYEQLEVIYTHPDSSTSVGHPVPPLGNRDDVEGPPQWGKVIKESSDGRPSLYARDLGNGHKVFTFVIWAE